MKNAEALDLREYRPAAVLALDLVKHSTKAKAAALRIRKAVEEIFAREVRSLGIVDAYFNYTGDGYICAFVGDASARIIDFVNSTFPQLSREFAIDDQQFRAGLDFGLVHLSRNALTGAVEHFDSPGIVASRLERVAEPNEILCTETIRNIFAPLYEEMFDQTPRLAHTKDRDIACYQLRPIDYFEIQNLFRAALLRTGPERPLLEGNRTRILIVDDDDAIRMTLASFLPEELPGLEAVAFSSGKDAEDAFAPGRFALALIDEGLPDIDGLELSRRLLAADPEQSVLMMTGHASAVLAKRFLAAGGAYFLAKPFDLDSLMSAIRLCIQRLHPRTLLDRLQLVCDDLGEILWGLQIASDRLYSLLHRQHSSAASSLLRHKAKRLAADFVSRINPGCDIAAALPALSVQLSSLDRLARLIDRANLKELQKYFENLAADYARLYPDVSVRVDADLAELSETTVPHVSLYAMAVCELVDNAVSAVEGKGQISITMSALPTAGYLHTTVRDDGTGVPLQVEPAMFEEGVSSKGAGRGLGLSLVREAIHGMGGQVTYRYDAGAVFTMSVPLAAEPAPPTETSRPMRSRRDLGSSH